MLRLWLIALVSGGSRGWRAKKASICVRITNSVASNSEKKSIGDARGSTFANCEANSGSRKAIVDVIVMIETQFIVLVRMKTAGLTDATFVLMLCLSPAVNLCLLVV